MKLYYVWGMELYNVHGTQHQAHLAYLHHISECVHFIVVNRTIRLRTEVEAEERFGLDMSSETVNIFTACWVIVKMT